MWTPPVRYHLLYSEPGMLLPDFAHPGEGFLTRNADARMIDGEATSHPLQLMTSPIRSHWRLNVPLIELSRGRTKGNRSSMHPWLSQRPFQMHPIGLRTFSRSLA